MIIEEYESAGTLLGISRLASNLKIDGVIIKRSGSTVILYLLGQTLEGLLDVLAVLGTDLQEEHVMFLGQHPTFLLLDFSFSLKVAFGADQDLADDLTAVALNLFDPATDAPKAHLIIDGVGQNYSCSSFVVCLSDIAESFLSSRVPDL